MNDINPQNYDGANVTVVGRAGGPVNVKEFASGSSIAELSIAVGQGYKKGEEWVDTGTTWYTLTATADYAADNWPVIGKGDKVRVDNARQETREYERKQGGAGLQITLKFGTLSVIQAKGEGTPVAAGAATSDFGSTEATPW